MIACLLAAFGAPATLGPGSMAPGMGVRTWYKGTPVKSFDKAKTYVLEFWATWSDPSEESIPHLTQLAKANPDVTVIGVSIWEPDDGSNIKEFVDRMGAKMEYHVGYGGNREGMGRKWIEAAGLDSIPTVFIVSQGKIRWIGPPGDLDQPLAAIEAGKFDDQEALKEFKVVQAKAAADREVSADLDKADLLHDAGDLAAAQKQLTDAVAKEPEVAKLVQVKQLNWLASDDPKAWIVKIKSFADSKDEEQIQEAGESAVALEKANKLLARQAIETLLQATGGKSFLASYSAEEFYAIDKDVPNTLKYLDQALALLPNAKLKEAEKKTILQTLNARKIEFQKADQ